MKIWMKYILRIGVVIGLYVGVAMLVNLSNRILDVHDRVTNYAFWWTLLPSTLLLVGYSYLLTFLYYRYTKVGLGTSHPYLHLSVFVLLSILLISSVQVSFLIAVGEIAERPFDMTRYLRRDYPYFAVPLLIFSVLLYHRPKMRLYRLRAPHGQSQGDIKHLLTDVDWRQEKNISFLQLHLIERLGYRKEIDLDDIRYFDVFCFTSTLKEHILYLVNGERISVRFTSSAIKNWALAKWFVKTNKDVMVNMVHVMYPVQNMRQLEINALLQANLTAHMFREDVHDLLHVSKRLSAKNLRYFLDNIDALEDRGWDDKVDL